MRNGAFYLVLMNLSENHSHPLVDGGSWWNASVSFVYIKRIRILRLHAVFSINPLPFATRMKTSAHAAYI